MSWLAQKRIEIGPVGIIALKRWVRNLQEGEFRGKKDPLSQF